MSRKWILIIILVILIAVFIVQNVSGAGILGERWLQPGLKNLRKWEGSFTYPYLDTKGLPTVGIGNLVKTADAAVNLPWQIEGRRATEIEIRSEFAKLQRATPALAAPAYEKVTRLRLSETDVEALVARRVGTEFVPGLRSLYPAFDSFPEPAKIALLDMIYSLGQGGLGKFSKLQAALNRPQPDFYAASLTMTRKGARPERDANNRILMQAASGKDLVA